MPDEVIQETRKPSLVFTVTSIEQADPPDGADGDWFRYTIENGGSQITGVRRGSKQQVRTHAESFAEELNTRVKGRGPSTWTTRIKK